MVSEVVFRQAVAEAQSDTAFCDQKLLRAVERSRTIENADFEAHLAPLRIEAERYRIANETGGYPEPAPELRLPMSLQGAFMAVAAAPMFPEVLGEYSNAYDAGRRNMLSAVSGYSHDEWVVGIAQRSQDWVTGSHTSPEWILEHPGRSGFDLVVTVGSDPATYALLVLEGASAMRSARGGILKLFDDCPSIAPNSGFRQTGSGFFTGSADEAYDAIRASTSDVQTIARNTGIKPQNIQKVKNHVFYEKHLLDRYVDYGVPAELRRFDSDLGIGNAWKRLETSTFTDADLQLLRHEAAESHLMRRWADQSYNRAHTRAQQRYPYNPTPGVD